MKLVVEMHFRYPRNIVIEMNKIMDEIRAGNMQGNSPHVKWEVLLTKEPEFRIEEIDGKECYIFPSKMNKDG